MSTVSLPRHAAWLAAAAGIAVGMLAFLLVAPPAPEPASVHASGERIPLFWHSRTKITVVDFKWVAPGVAEILTRRDGRTGTSFTRRRIDCDTRRIVLLGEGLTEAAARQARPAPAAPTAAVENTIPFAILAWTCK
jgi:hypothetical protein